MMVRKGVDVGTALAQLQHSDPRLTLGVYTQATAGANRAASTFWPTCSKGL
jgi:hypothetical protein